jgi:hypothetical protein
LPAKPFFHAVPDLNAQPSSQAHLKIIVAVAVIAMALQKHPASILSEI